MVKSRKPGKQRKAQYNASMHTKRKRVTARLQLDKPDERFAGVRSVTVRAGDTVRVIAGDHKGSEGKILKLLSSKDKAIVEGVNVVKRHTKPNAQNPQGGILEKEAAIHVSNLSLLTTDGETTRVGYQMNGENKERISRKTKEVI